ncbi:MFS transporter [Nakamurella flavida]|uniref:MFS transporter n=1 Tax=Nakamurella flavida TaxID=363630 RepID=A0A939C1V2_9ACTN|nr:MFS transporter [Nakamurella flavida]MBM9478078.1 MFS transporter [Nakamurella flavida]MDP9778701.1 sugar phosphate permease [Nakamurella flavida]
MSASRLRWFVWGVAVLCYVAGVTARSSLAAVGADAVERFSLSASMLSGFAVLQLVVYAGMQIPVGILVDRWGPRVLIAGGAALIAGGQTLLAVAGDVRFALLGRAVVGAGDAMTFVSILRLLPAWFPARVTPVLTQVTGMLGQLGQLISVIPFAALVGLQGWRTAFLGLAGAHLLAAILAGLVLRDSPSARTRPVTAGTLRAAAAGVRVAWAHPGTRLGFWSHFSTPFAGTVFALLWGYPFLVSGEGLTRAGAAGLMVVFVVANLAAAPVIGQLVATHPLRRSWLVLGMVAVQATAWALVLAWPGRAPSTVLTVLVIALAVGGPASMIGFDYARTSNPLTRLGAASGAVNGAGFLAAILALLGVGLVLDLQGAGAGDPTLGQFRWAMLVHYPVWILGVVQVLRWRRRLRALMADEGVVVPPLRVVYRQRLFAAFTGPGGRASAPTPSTAAPSVRTATGADDKESP